MSDQNSPGAGQPLSNVMPPPGAGRGSTGPGGGGAGSVAGAVVDPEEILSPDELKEFAAVLERRRAEQEEAETREAAFQELAGTYGLDGSEAKKVLKDLDRERRRKEAEVARQQSEAKRDSQTKEKKKGQEAKKRETEKQQRKARTRRRVGRAASNLAAKAIGSTSPDSLLAELLLFLIVLGAFGIGVVFLPPISRFLETVNTVLERLANPAGFLTGENSQEAGAAVTAGAIHSPLEGITLQQLVEYQPTPGQSFGPKTGNSRSYGLHGGVDFDGTVGGYAGNKVKAVEASTVIAVDDLCGDGSSYRIMYRATSATVLDQPVVHRAVHVSGPLVSVGDVLAAGQQIATVAPTDCASTGPHYDHKIQLGDENGEWFDPQEYFRLALELGGTAGEIPEAALILIRNAESFHQTPYWDFAQFSWGYGTRAPCNSEGECAGISITRDQAETEMRAFLAETCSPLLEAVSVYDEMQNGQKGAFFSLCYNLGGGQFAESDAYQTLVAGDVIAACELFDNYVHATENGVKVKLAGLVRRRNEEQEYCGVELPWNN